MSLDITEDDDPADALDLQVKAAAVAGNMVALAETAIANTQIDRALCVTLAAAEAIAAWAHWFCIEGARGPALAAR